MIKCAAILATSVLLCALPIFGNKQTTPKLTEGAGWEALKSKVLRAIPEDQPGEAQEFFRLKRSPDGGGPVPVERYLRANRQARRMSQHSTALDTTLPSQDEMRAQGSEELMSLGSWTQLGPGNIGGRTRSLLINPSTPATMYAAGVAGGVWKTTNSGTSWTPLADLIANIAVNSLAMDPANSSTLYAGTGEGNSNFDSVRGLGIFKTTDAGANWSQLATTNNSNFWFVNTLVVSPNNSLRIYAGTNTGIWRSTDGGANWSQVFNPGTPGGCFKLVIRTDQPTDTMLASIGTFTQSTVYRNTDAGGAGIWNSVLTEAAMGLTSLAIAPSNQATMYACASDKGTGSGAYALGLDAVFRSTDGGASWAARVRNTNPTKLNTLLLTNPVIASLVECGFGTSNSFINQGWYDNVIAVDPLDPNRVWVGGIDLFRSDDGGANWGLASYWWPGSSAHADQHVIVFDPQYNGTSNQNMFVGNDGGIFKTTNARASVATGSSAVCDPGNTSVTWTALNHNYGVTQFYYGAVYPNGLTYFGGTQDNGTNRGTQAGGIDGWANILGGDGGAVAVDPANTNNLYAENTGLSIAKSTDGGDTFSDAVSGISEAPDDFLFISPFIMDPSNSSLLWTGGFFLWRTITGANLWTQASAITPGNGSVSAIAVAPANANNAIAGLSDGFIVRTNIALTSTAATSWASVRPRTGYVAGVTFDPVNANVAYAAYSSFNSLPSDKHVYNTTDAGATWVAIDGSGPSALPDVPAHSIAIDPNNSSKLYVGTDIGVFVTTDGGANWARENTGFANVITESLVVNTVGGASTLHAFTHGRGAWRVALPAAAPGTDTIGIYNPAGAAFFLRNSNSGGVADITFTYGPSGMGLIPLMGDWDGDGDDTPGLYDPANAAFFLRNSNSGGNADITFTFGPPGLGFVPIVGDWNGDGIDTIGLYNPSAAAFFLRNSNTGGIADIIFTYGPAGMGFKPLVGDWNGDGTDTIGLYSPSNAAFFLRNTNSGGVADITFTYGPAGLGFIAVIGDWDGNGTDTIGLYSPANAAFFLRNTNTGGIADITFTYGPAASGFIPLIGDWDGL